MNPAVELTQSLSNFMKARIMSTVQGQETIPIPDNLDAETIYECNLAVEVIRQAYLNQEHTKWDAEDYMTYLTTRCTGQNPLVEDGLKAKFPPLHSETQYRNKPGAMTDCRGNIMVWYLPGILTIERVDTMWRSLQSVEDLLQKTPSSTSWRVNDTHFRHEPGWLRPGNVNFSPAWFQQAHEKVNPLEVSSDLSKPAGQEFIRRMMTSSALLGAILSIIHPEQYQAGMEFLDRIAANPAAIHKADILKQILTIWSAPFGVISVISNRDTPFHRDNGACHFWYDLLMPLGKYNNGRLELPGLGLRFKYNPKTIVAITGRLLQHGVKCEGDRAVIAFYMRKTVLEALGVGEAGWSNTSDMLLGLNVK